MMRKRLIVIVRWSLWYRGYRVVGYSWCCARIIGKDQAPCGHLMITTVLFIPSLIWSWDDRVMSEVGKWCAWWLRDNPSSIIGAYSVIMLHASIVRFICSCYAHIVLAVSGSYCLWILSGYYDYFPDGIWYYLEYYFGYHVLMSFWYYDLMLIPA